ncbi:MAG: AAA family ATPase [Tannerella sp.]|jgi:predicted ATP-binding protein involved in virulence|nr:AAA family ATPase [Tannerella sp.]
MKLDRLHLQHFRCFEDFRIDFAPGINVLTGANSSGKTTVLEAARRALSTFFTGFSDENTKFIGLSDEDFSVQESESGEEITAKNPVRVSFSLNGKEGLLQLNSKKTGTLKTPLRNIENMTKDIYNGHFLEKRRVLSLPMFTYFSTKEIVKEPRDIDYKTQPSFGYRECLEGTDLFYYWIKRLLVLVEAGKNAEEIESIKQAVADALGKDGCGIIEGMDIRPNKKSVYFLFTDGREIDYKHLSDGYDRLVNMVIDLASRAMVLNKGIYGAEACRKTEGVVLIDEIDLHLHPEMQLKVLNGLQKAFPALQFIVTTHSPLVAAGLKAGENNKLFNLAYNGENYICNAADIYGMDASTTLKTYMGAPSRVPAIQEHLDELEQAIDDEEIEKAESLLQGLKQEASSLPEIVKFETMITWLKDEKNQ